jgi:hypothetical protein
MTRYNQASTKAFCLLYLLVGMDAAQRCSISMGPPLDPAQLAQPARLFVRLFAKFIDLCVAKTSSGLAPALKRNDIVVVDDLPAHKVPGVREAIFALRTSKRSRSLSRAAKHG